MAGTVSTPIFKQDGQYLTFAVETGQTVTLGQVVKLVTTGTPSTVQPAGAADTNVIGVAVAANRVSRTATDNVVQAGDLVTVLTRGVANVTADTAGITVGGCVSAGTAGTAVDIVVTSYQDLTKILGRALETATSGNVAAVLITII